MKVTRLSPYSQIEHTYELDVTEEELQAFYNGKAASAAFPRLTQEKIEFIKSGITPSEWRKMFGKKCCGYTQIHVLATIYILGIILMILMILFSIPEGEKVNDPAMKNKIDHFEEMRR